MSFFEALVQLVVAVAGTFVVFGSWLGLQGFVRRKSGCRPDHDVLDFMAHGCGSCIRGETCKNRMKKAGLNPGTEQNHHEPE
ncbi:MAG TPA: hypothetical protein VNH18_24230 [Bryobacteraceae bacterium]|nr:hypothetical protein [Bryobacteraceae bacterium]